MQLASRTHITGKYSRVLLSGSSTCQAPCKLRIAGQDRTRQRRRVVWWRCTAPTAPLRRRFCQSSVRPHFDLHNCTGNAGLSARRVRAVRRGSAVVRPAAVSCSAVDQPALGHREGDAAYCSKRAGAANCGKLPKLPSQVPTPTNTHATGRSSSHLARRSPRHPPSRHPAQL